MSVPEGSIITVSELADEVVREADVLERELTEIDMLVTQARTESGRHDQRRAQVSDRVNELVASRSGPAPELAELTTQLVTLTRRAAIMEAQVDVLEGKRRVIARYRDGLLAIAGRLRGSGAGDQELGSEPAGAPDEATVADRTAALSRLVLTAQEDLRRDIARAIHDGPAQSLTNIVLQAQIVDRLIEHDPAAARAETTGLVQMVQRTLEATKTFIFDVRPMVLDDLGLVPTLRRVARDRSRRAGIPIEFESLGSDRRLPMEIESGVFRMIDESLAALLSAQPRRVRIDLDWADALAVRVSAERASTTPLEAPAVIPQSSSKNVLPALVAMVEERRDEARRAREAAEAAAQEPLFGSQLQRELRDRAEALGATLEIGPDELSLRLELSAL